MGGLFAGGTGHCGRLALADRADLAAAKSPAPYVFSAQSAPAAAPLLDINTADAAALTALPGVGQAKAEAIVRYRDEHGFFAALQDVAAVSGISQRMVESWAGLACVQPPVKEQEEHNLG